MPDPFDEVRCPKCGGAGKVLVERLVGAPQEPRPRGLLPGVFWDAAHRTGALYTASCARCGGAGTVLAFTCEPKAAGAVVDSLIPPEDRHG